MTIALSVLVGTIFGATLVVAGVLVYMVKSPIIR